LSEEQSLEFLLFSGSYDEVLRRTAGEHSAGEWPILVGALSLSGRLDEAESAFTSHAVQAGGTSSVAEARFFLVAGLCHAGNLVRAVRYAKDSVSDTRSSNAKRRFFAFQSLAAVRYFEGRFPLARRLARRALASAVAASFPYARFLALDMMAHVLVHTGDVFAGLRLLSQAESLAAALGYVDNASTERTAALVFRLRMLLTDIDEALASVESVVRSSEVSYFTRRNGLLELAGMFALRGAATSAAVALDEARQIALTGSDRRGRTRFLVCSALTTALSRGPEEAQPIIEEARTLAREQLTLTAEVAFVDSMILGCRDTTVLAEYDAVARRTGIQRARLASDAASGAMSNRPSYIEDGLARILVGCAGLSAFERVEAVIAARLYGLVPWALGRSPGKRIIVTGSSLVTEHRGTVTVRELPSRPSLKTLFALARGYQSRAALIADVWSILRFVPARHIAVIHTAVSRLRLALAEPDWIVTHDDGYALAEGVELVTLEGTSVPVASAIPPALADRDRALSFIDKNGPSSSAQVAAALKLSASTALRVLRALADEGTLEKSGGGRATRYRLRLIGN
jgi:hypothetical protein